LRPASLRYLQKQLYALHPENPDDRYVEFIVPPRPRDTRFGSSPTVYTLGKKGYSFLRKKGKEVGRYRPPDTRLHEEFPLRHRLALNEFLLKAMLLKDEQPNLELFEHKHETYWLAHPLKVTLPNREKPVGVSPDLLLAFATIKPFNQDWFLPEINLSEMWRRDWEEKVAAYLHCIPEYEKRFGTTVLTSIPVMVVSKLAFPRMLYVKPTEEYLRERQRERQRRQKRMHTLLHWTEVVLDKLNMREEADLFSFSCAPLDTLTPTELFLGSHWYIPFSDTPRPLILTDKEEYT
jgi:hypothetical protein